ncbi:polysaccharide deacetylase family protein [Clostridium botulinum]|uniref:Polysaccharide deacetylase family protein n=3 Tax=Clostridium botulinum TaxID=1491 RepID=C1FQ28_CLOBJ|nr:polysaccharide deacetylase family protein [Clostridium botulinum]ACO84762.1 polysaccharide deacetylase family protein [Clostridium botulinum A2 str. Kyoto]APC84908.1 polysaccharide deacetylase family protein [Clostridium botulinum]APH24183.1 polysaccharide deacetylase family protein [Clostridium botulinum]APQ69262.1 polysaccharide deacetylase family protein [Clostridium botulinum]APQ73307.1 polysaccharide deacetylase family protein [Clostridium botulinum]
MKNKKSLIFFAFIMMIAVLFSGCKKNNNVDDNNISEKKAQSKKQESNIKNTDVRSFTKEPLIYNDKSVPVLMYHSIDYEKGNELRVPKEQFKEQMEYLKDNGYTTLTLNELYNFLKKNKPIPEKSIVITLDDGYVDNYTNAYPILKELGFNATVFVITSNIDKDKRTLTSKQIKEMDEAGIQIASHTYNHDKLDDLSYEKQLQTMKKSKDDLEKILNHKVDFIAYPYGKWNEESIKAAKDAGYKMAFTTQGGWSNKQDGIYTLNRVYISSLKGIDNFKDRITNPNYNKS